MANWKIDYDKILNEYERFKEFFKNNGRRKFKDLLDDKRLQNEFFKVFSINRETLLSCITWKKDTVKFPVVKKLTKIVGVGVKAKCPRCGKVMTIRVVKRPFDYKCVDCGLWIILKK